MKTLTYGMLLVLISAFSGCRTVLVNKSLMHTASTTPIALGVIGSHKNKVMVSEYTVAAIPVYKQRLRVGVSEQAFTKGTFKAYLGINKKNTARIKYVDSLDKKPTYLNLELLDQVTLLAELQELHNQETQTYIKHQPNAEIVSSVSIAMNKELLKEVTNAEAVFLINNKPKQYGLSLIQGGKSVKTIDFAEASIFAYRLSSFCWGEGERRKIKIFDLVDEASSCPKNTYKSAIKAEEKMSYFKL